MIEADWSRKYINAQVQRLRHVFKWAAAREMVPVAVYEALRTLEPLRHGRCEARETSKVTPVSDSMLDAVRPHLPGPVRAVVVLSDEAIGLEPPREGRSRNLLARDLVLAEGVAAVPLELVAGTEGAGLDERAGAVTG